MPQAMHLSMAWTHAPHRLATRTTSDFTTSVCHAATLAGRFESFSRARSSCVHLGAAALQGGGWAKNLALCMAGLPAVLKAGTLRPQVAGYRCSSDELIRRSSGWLT